MMATIESVGKAARAMRCMISLFILLLVASVGFTQLPTAAILGVVKDSSGAVVPNAALTSRNLETGQTRTTTSAADGSFRLPALPVGNYEVRAEHSGFQTELRSGLTLTVAQEAVVNFTLQVGAVEQTVAVTAQAPLVETTSGTLGGMVDQQKVAELPLNGRNFMDLTLLQPGVEKTNISGTGGPIMRGIWFSSNGASGRSNAYLLDGAPMQNLNGNSPAGSVNDSTLGIEGIRELRVVTTSFSAEYGMVVGSQTIIVSKGGTNNFHGSALEFLRNSALDARNFFDRITPTTPRRLPVFVRNNFGGSFGGPIKKDRAFFHLVYEGVRERLGRTIISNVIPSSAKVDGGAGGVAQISPVIKPFLQYFPDPNLPPNQFTYSPSQPTNEDYGQVRIDQTISNNDTLFGRYTVTVTEQTLPGSYALFPTIQGDRGQFATVSETHIFSPTLLNTFRLSFSRTNIFGDPPSGMPSGPQVSFLPGKPVGTLSIGGVTTWGASSVTPLAHKQNIFAYSDDMYYTRGSHSLKFGTLINRYQMWLLSGLQVRGQATFASLQTFLAGGPVVSIVGLTPGSVLDKTYHMTTLGFYLQDDWRVSSRWTLNLGLRYEPTTDFTEVHNNEFTLHDAKTDVRTTAGLPFLNPSKKNISPRFGFAWDVRGNGRTAVRGGLALLYDVASFNGSLLSNNNPPVASASTVANVSTLTVPFAFPPSAAGKTLRQPAYIQQQPHMLQFSLTVERQLPFDSALTVSYVGTRGLNLLQSLEGNPTVPRTLPDGRVFWTGAESRVNPNWDGIEYKSAGGDSWYNALQVQLNKRLSKGFQLQSSYTWSKTIDITQSQISGDGDPQMIYPGHRTLDKAVASFNNSHNWRLNAIYRLPGRGSAGSILGKFRNGWWMSGILSLNTGFPLSAQVQANRSLSKINVGSLYGVSDRPDLVAGRNKSNTASGTSAGCPGVAAGTQLGTPTRYFDPCAFTVPAAGFLGTAGRNIMVGPGLATLDYSLVKDTALKMLGEGGQLQFRAEFFNILNHANFAQPSNIVFAAAQNVEPALGSAGTIVSTRTTSRQIQFALKLVF